MAADSLYRWFSTERIRTPGDFSWSRLQSSEDSSRGISGEELVSLVESTPNDTDVINLSGINLGENDPKLFSNLLRAIRPNINSLDLSFNHLHLLNCSQLIAAFCLLPSSVTTLILNNNKLHHLGFEDFKRILCALPTTTQTVHLLNNGLDKYPSEDLRVFLDSLEKTIYLLDPSELSEESYYDGASYK